MIWFFETLRSSSKYSFCGGSESHFVLFALYFFNRPLSVMFIPYGGSTTASSNALSGSDFMYSMQSMLYATLIDTTSFPPRLHSFWYCTRSCAIALLESASVFPTPLALSWLLRRFYNLRVYVQGYTLKAILARSGWLYSHSLLWERYSFAHSMYMSASISSSSR